MAPAMLLLLLCTPHVDGGVHPGLNNIATKAYSPSVTDPVVFANLWRSWDSPSRDIAEKAPEEVRRQMTLDRYGLLAAPYDNGGAPLGMTVTKDGSYAINCFICHVGAVEGKTFFGLSNSALDFSAIYEDIAQTVTILHAGKPGNPPFPEGLVSMSPGKDPANVHFPEGMLSFSRGTTNSFTFSVHFLSNRDNDLNLLNKALELRPLNHYLDPPAWWHTAKKKAFYSDGFADKSIRPLMQFSLDPSVEAAQFKSWEDDYKEIYAWLHTIESPRYQGQIDPELASNGKRIYTVSCAQCHGLPGRDGDYENLIVPIEEVKTDRSRLDGLSVEFKKHFDSSWMGSYGKGGIRVYAEGYVAPPLDGVWATAPYFHNGSVPTLYHVLFPDERPTVWKVRDYLAYDHSRVGLLIDEHKHMPQTVTRSERRRFYDSNQKSMSNGGHPFADSLSREQKLSVLEFLKSL